MANERETSPDRVTPDLEQSRGGLGEVGCTGDAHRGGCKLPTCVLGVRGAVGPREGPLC